MSLDYSGRTLYLNVPYSEKDEAKKLGARYDASIKKWYYNGLVKNYKNFAKWILKDNDEAYIAYEYIHILETKRSCWKCKKNTTVIALGIGEYIYLYKNDDNTIELIFDENYENCEPIHIAWVNDEKDIPPKLLRYLKTHYPVKMNYSHGAGKCFANHCEHCGAIQGNNFIFDEVDSPFFPTSNNKMDLTDKLSQISIKMIPIDSNLHLNWDIIFGDYDDVYLKFGKSEELILSSNTDDDWISYQDMYELLPNATKRERNSQISTNNSFQNSFFPLISDSKSTITISKYVYLIEVKYYCGNQKCQGTPFISLGMKNTENSNKITVLEIDISKANKNKEKAIQLIKEATPLGLWEYINDNYLTKGYLPAFIRGYCTKCKYCNNPFYVYTHIYENCNIFKNELPLPSESKKKGLLNIFKSEVPKPHSEIRVIAYPLIENVKLNWSKTHSEIDCPADNIN